MEHYAIIVAGGKGARMKSEVPKQFLLLDGEPIIVKTIKAFFSYSDRVKIILVLPEDHQERWNEIRAFYFPQQSIRSTIGGETRTQSVIAGLNQIQSEGLVAIHDAVRPFVTKEVIAKSYESAANYGSGVAVVPLKDSIRERLEDGQSKARDREHFVLVQTPQAFRLSEIRKAYQGVNDTDSYSDDASVYEGAGYVVHLVEGSYSNIKITTPEDLT